MYLKKGKDYYEKKKDCENVSDGKWAPKSITEYTNRLAMLPEVMGDCLLNEIDFDATRQFFDKLKRLPPNRTKIKGYRGKSISQLLKMIN